MGSVGETLAFGNWAYLKPSDHKWWKANAGAAATAIEPLGVALGSIGTAAAGTIMRVGLYRSDSGFGGAVTDGTPAFLATSAGEITATAPSGATEIIRAIGHFRSPDGSARMVDVNPDNIWVEHT